MKLLYKTTRRFNGKVSNFLPKKKGDLDTWAKKLEKEPFALAALDRKSVLGLEMNAKCLSYAKAKATPQFTGVVATREIAEGSTVIPVPLLILSTLSTDNDESCLPDSETGQCTAQRFASGSKTTRCMSHTDLPFLLCPLSQADRITIVDANTSDEVPAPNVEYKWSTWNSHNLKSHEITTNEVARVSD